MLIDEGKAWEEVSLPVGKLAVVNQRGMGSGRGGQRPGWEVVLEAGT